MLFEKNKRDKLEDKMMSGNFTHRGEIKIK